MIKKTDIVPEDSLLMRYLSEHKDELQNRDDTKDGFNWYSLRDCSYYDAFSEPKIIYPDICTKSRFSFDNEGLYITDGSFFLPTSSYYLLGLLNSSVANFYFKLKLSGLGTPGNGGRIRFKKTYVESFPVPDGNESNKIIIDEIEKNTREMIAKEEWGQEVIDDLVAKLYHLDADTRTLIESKM